MAEGSLAGVRARAVRRRLPRTGWRALLPGIAVLLALELFGRWSPHDRWDLVGVVALVAALVATSKRLSVRSLARLRLARRHVRRWFAPLSIDLGVDFRGEPPLAPRVPRPHAGVFAALVAAAIVAALTAAGWPTVARETLGAISGVLLIACTAFGWSLLLVLGLLLLILPTFLFNAHLLDRGLSRRRRFRISLRLGCASFAGVAAALLLLDARIALTVVVAVAVAHGALALLPTRRPLQLAWRRGPGGTPWALGGGVLLAGVSTSVALVVVTFALLAAGDRFDGAALDPNALDTTAISAWIGRAFAWCAAFGTAALFGKEGLELFLGRWHDPARPVRPRVHVDGELSAIERRALAGVLARTGLRLAGGRERSRAALALRLVDAPVERDPFDEPTWPLAVTKEELFDDEVRRRVARRDETVRRRAAIEGLRALLTHAESREFEHGTGYWVAPHLWYVQHLTRDTDDEDCWFVGPPWHRVLSRAARNHLAQVYDSLDVDLVFLEDGVGVERFVQLLELMFEHVDLFGDTRPADPRHFTGIPGVRVLIHSCEFEEPLVDTGYTETDYEELARARILHVFVDRGGDDADVKVPHFGNWVPSGAPSLVPN